MIADVIYNSHQWVLSDESEEKCEILMKNFEIIGAIRVWCHMKFAVQSNYWGSRPKIKSLFKYTLGLTIEDSLV